METKRHPRVNFRDFPDGTVAVGEGPLGRVCEGFFAKMCVGGMGQTLLRGRELVGFGVRNLPPMVRVTTGKAAFPVASGLVWTGFGDIDHDH